jgi:hypothetical protein
MSSDSPVVSPLFPVGAVFFALTLVWILTA